MRRTMWSAMSMTMLLSACATGSPTARLNPDLPTTVARLQSHREQGRTGSVWGFLYLREPGVPIPMKDWPVTLLPLTPELETAVQRVRQSYRAGGYTLLPFQTMDRLKQTLDSHRAGLRDAGRGDLIRQVRTETGDDPKFEFLDVPEGRWLLLTELPAPPAMAVWVVPITVTVGTATKQSLNDLTVIEGLIR